MSTRYGSVASLTRTGPSSDFLQESPHRAGAAVRGGRPSLWRVRQFSFHVDGNTNICAHTHKHNIHAHTTQSSHAQHACTYHNIHVLHMQTHTYTTNICAHTHKQNIHVIDTHTPHTIHTHNTHMLHVQTHTHTQHPCTPAPIYSGAARCLSSALLLWPRARVPGTRTRSTCP